MTWPPRGEEPIIRRIMAETCILGGAGRAILLQVGHPLVGRGVAEHSQFAKDPMARLRGTLNYVYGTIFGSPDEAEWVASRVRRIHEHVVGPGYTAADPALQLWVAATLYDSALQVSELVFGPMPRTLKEEFCQQMATLATTLGCPEELWPKSVADFETYWAQEIERLEITDESRRICHELMYSRSLPWYAVVLSPVNRMVTAGLLPARLRNDYDLAWGRGREWLFGLGVRGARLTYRHVPKRIRHLPMAYYLRSLRRQIRLQNRLRRTSPR